MGTRILIRKLKTEHWLVHWVEWFKDNANKESLLWKVMDRPETSHYHKCLRRSNVSSGIYARPSVVKTDLRDKEMSYRTSQAHDSSKFGTSGRRKRDLCRSMILKDHDVKIGKITHWSVSTTVLRWLQSAHKKQQVFVANRTAEILESSSMDQWKNVKGSETSEDIGTRGKSNERINETDWLNEPA